MPLSRPDRDRLHQPWWFLVLLAAYAVLELSFNHHLMQVSAGEAVGMARIEDLEFWARIISGLGLAFWLLRPLRRRLPSVALALLLSVSIGVGVMWHVQRWLVDAIVARASDTEKQMSLYAQQLVPEALAGHVQVRGLPLVEPERLSPASRLAWQALLPALTLGLLPQDLQAATPVMQAMAVLDLAAPDNQAQLLTDAYRRVVMVPIALGVSLLFGLANLCLLASLLAQRFGGAPTAWRQRTLFVLLWAALLVWSWNHSPGQAESQAYVAVARPALRTEQPLLAPFVEWSLRAEPAWHEATRWLHQQLLGGYGFRKPSLAERLAL